jgi:hypothetical protein
MSQTADVHATRERRGNKLIYARQVVENVQNQEMQSYRRGDSATDPTLTRTTRFSVKDDKSDVSFYMCFDGIDREVYWPEFIENGDEITFIAQAPIFASGVASVVGYVNHTKCTGIQMSLLSRQYVLMICGLFSILAVVNLASENIGSLGYLLTLPTLFLSAIVFMRSTQKKSFQNDFERYIKENEQAFAFFEKEKRSQAFKLRYETSKEELPLEAQTIESPMNEDSEAESIVISIDIAQSHFPNINSIPKNCSQQRYLDSFVSTEKVRDKETLKGGAEVVASYDYKKFDGIDFDELVKLREKNLWHIYHNSQVLGVVIVEEETALLGRYFFGEVIPKKGVTIEVLKKGRVRHCKSGSSRKNLNLVIIDKKVAIFASWNQQQKRKWTSNSERRKRKKRR